MVLSPQLRHWLINKQPLHQELRVLLESPVFIEAVRLVIEDITKPVDYGAQNILEVNALSHAEATGARNLVEKLVTLSNPPIALLEAAKPPVTLPQPFECYKHEAPVSTLV